MIAECNVLRIAENTSFPIVVLLHPKKWKHVEFRAAVAKEVGRGCLQKKRPTARITAVLYRAIYGIVDQGIPELRGGNTLKADPEASSCFVSRKRVFVSQQQFVTFWTDHFEDKSTFTALEADNAGCSIPRAVHRLAPRKLLKSLLFFVVQPLKLTRIHPMRNLL
jgi:hypothetical protein